MVEKIIKMISNLKILSKMNEIIDGLNTHTTNTNNPHNVTAEQLGLATAYVYKGSVTNFGDLPANAQNGWVYSVENEHTDSAGILHPAGANFAWDGSKWDDLGGSLSGYATIDFVENRVIPIEKGGTGATTASGACKNLGAVQTVNGVAPDASGNVKVSAVAGSNIVNIIYPVGSIYMSMSSTNPAELFGGTWEQIAQGRCLIGAGTGTDSRSESKTFTAGDTGGEYSHKLTVGEMPSHNHGASSSNIGSHTHFVASSSKGSPIRDNTNLSSTNRLTYYATNHSLVEGYILQGTSGAANVGASSSAGTTSTTVTIANNGSDGAHNNIQPYLAVYYWKRTA